MTTPPLPPRPDSAAAWARLAVAVALSAVGGVGMWSVVVALPAVQAEFGSARAGASLPYTLAMIGFALGGVLAGRLTDRFGITAPILAGTLCLSLGYGAAALSGDLTQFALAHGLLIGLGASATFAPLMADISKWFVRRRGIAVSICASGNYFAGAVWPSIVQAGIAAHGWRATHVAIGLACLVIMVPLALLMRRPAPGQGQVRTPAPAGGGLQAPGLSPGALQALLVVAGFACCIAMSMPQVHIVAYCVDLGYGPARGAEMLSLMLACGIVSRIGSGWIADRIGGVRTLLLGSTLQGLALVLYLPFDGLASLYAVSALFGLFQGGLVPSYALIVRELFPAREAGTRVGLVIMATLLGMAAGGWSSGLIYDLTGSYRAAFLHGIAWNVVNVAIMTWLLARSGASGLRAQPA